MPEIKYKYAFDESGNIVSIDNYTNAEECKQHSYKCISCGSELRPRAIQSKYRQPHFYHKQLIDCSGETYLHKLGKYLIKKKFDESEHFWISYSIKEKCNKSNCPLRNVKCDDNYNSYKENEIDLKMYYDTCTEEVLIDNFKADLLLTNSNDTQTPPILIEICVTHPCEEEKLRSGHKIIEIKLEKEQDIIDVYNEDQLREGIFASFYAFKRETEKTKRVKIYRYIYNSLLNYNGILFEIYCDNSSYKFFDDSLVELNIVSKDYGIDCIDIACREWMEQYYKIKSCKWCKYYSGFNDGPVYCHMSNKYGTPRFPSYNYANQCSFYRTLWGSQIDNVKIEVVNALNDNKELYYVITLFDELVSDKILINNTLDYYLSEIRKFRRIVFLCYSKYYAIKKIRDYCADNSIPIVDYEIQWDKLQQKSYIEVNNKMIERANALIIFRLTGSTKYDSIIRLAQQKPIKYAIVDV